MSNSVHPKIMHALRSLRLQQWAKIFISVCIVIQVCTAIAWLSPESAFRNSITEHTKLFWDFFALRQRWELFAPKIRDVNIEPMAILSFEDGSTTVWQLPHSDFNNQLEKFTKDRFHKWSIDALPYQDPYEPYWPDLARYAGRLHYDPANKPTTFMLLVFTGQIPLPSAGISRDHLPPKTDLRIPFVYRFHKEDFR